MSLGDGARVLYLWTKDASGNISTVARTVNVTLDNTLPSVAITDVTGPLRGGQTYSVIFTKSDATSGIASAVLEYDNGSGYATVAGFTGTSPYSWTVPGSNTTTAKLKLTVTDNSGNVNSAETAAFTVDSSLPTAPTVSRSSSALSNSTTVAI